MTSDDRRLPERELPTLLTERVVVEEKLDGSNVCIWRNGATVEVMGRGGIGAMDRGHQLGRLRAWCAEHAESLQKVWPVADAIYAEWLWVTHSVPYDRLPSLLCVLDLWSSDAGFLSLETRNAACRGAGLFAAPELFRGSLESVEAAVDLCGRSLFGPGGAEGIVIRSERGPPLAKLLGARFTRFDEQSFGRAHNRVVTA